MGDGIEQDEERFEPIYFSGCLSAPFLINSNSHCQMVRCPWLVMFPDDPSSLPPHVPGW